MRCVIGHVYFLRNKLEGGQLKATRDRCLAPGCPVLNIRKSRHFMQRIAPIY